MGNHLIDGEFQSDKYPTCPRGKVPLSIKDLAAQDLLWEYAQRHYLIDPEFSDDLREALKVAGFKSITQNPATLNFVFELQNLINKYSRESDSNTPDFLLAEYLEDCLNAYNKIAFGKEKWLRPLEKDRSELEANRINGFIKYGEK